MEKREFRFKEDFFCINGIYNIPALIICTSYGYDFETYCCKNCGEIYVKDLEKSYFEKTDFLKMCMGKTCEKCHFNLETSLVKYPENVFYNGKILKNNNPIFKLMCDDMDKLLKVYYLS